MSPTDIPIQHRMKRILECIQILSQNECISSTQRQQVAQSLRESRKTGDLSELHKMFKGMEYGALFPDIIDELIGLTSQT